MPDRNKRTQFRARKTAPFLAACDPEYPVPPLPHPARVA